MAATAGLLALAVPGFASDGYGSVNNFDAVNDNGTDAHGFEVEIEDAHSTDITYTYDWNHYGVPNISEDNTDPLHPKVHVRYESKKNLDGTWASYTAVPSGPIAPTDGHQFTNPAVNFGGEHFGVGFYGNPIAIRYWWLIDDGFGNLVHGTSVNIATPTFTYYPPAGGAPPAVQAAIVPPPPEVPPPLEFGEPSWVKETRTQTHNNHFVELRDLVTDDPDDPNDENWANGEPDEVEVEWQLFQVDYNSAGGGPNGELVGAPEDLPNGDEVITRRYDFFKYVGPIDAETGEALADTVGPDGIHGSGTRIIDGIEVDLSTVVVVGDYIGAQMAGFDAASQIGLIDHVQDGEVNQPYVDRTLVIGGTPPITTVATGAFPDGMVFDEVTGVLSGTPIVTGDFAFHVHSTDAAGGDVSSSFTLTILDPGIVEPLHVIVTTGSEPPDGGTTTGDGVALLDADTTVTATAAPNFEFTNWTDGGTVVSTSSSYTFTAIVNRELIAHFVPVGGPDTTAPVSSASASDTTQVGASISGTYAADDGAGSGVASVELFVKPPASAWTSAGAVTGGTFTYTPSAGSGEYRFATAATDVASNAEAAPVGADPGDVAVLWNSQTNGAFSYATIADGTYTFPLTPDLDVQIVFSGGASGGPLTVSRVTGDVSEAGLGAGRLIDETLTITGPFTGTAYITWTFDPASDDGLLAPFNTVFKINGGVITAQFTVPAGVNPIVIGPLSSFSNFYAGNNDASVPDWELYPE
ncbi:hypothetical protein HZA57_07395 [Candidatus Poribacteria bacterium]|nr:hypothetical protein [Candidatus Poribacteria bacterium]